MEADFQNFVVNLNYGAKSPDGRLIVAMATV